MDRETALIVALLTLGAGVFLLEFYNWKAIGQPEPETMPSTDNSQPESPQIIDMATDLIDSIVNPIKQVLAVWRPPAKYAGLISQAEQQYGIPPDMLARLLYQECRWREDIITGRIASPAGALGIAQFMPATAAEWGVRPLEPVSAIDGAGRYLKWLYGKFGSWKEALAAYNWGIGNVQRKGLLQAPRETQLYYSQILGDVNSANGTNWA